AEQTIEKAGQLFQLAIAAEHANDAGDVITGIGIDEANANLSRFGLRTIANESAENEHTETANAEQKRSHCCLRDKPIPSIPRAQALPGHALPARLRLARQSLASTACPGRAWARDVIPART